MSSVLKLALVKVESLRLEVVISFPIRAKSVLISGVTKAATTAVTVLLP
jgi:hypothetical protein